MRPHYLKPIVVFSRYLAVFVAAAWVLMACGGGSKNGAAGDDGGSPGSGDDGAVATADGGTIPVPTADGGPPACMPLSASAHAANLATLGANLDALVTGFEHSHASGTTITCPALGSSSEGTYDFGNYAWIKLARGTDANGTALALSALKCMFTFQDLTTGSPTYGVFRAHVNNSPNIADNSTESALVSVGWILADGLLPESSISGLVPGIEAALNAIDGHEECPNYTNICFVQQAVRLSIGAGFSASSDSAVAADGKMRTSKAMTELDNWAATVKQGGIVEFDSPTYAEDDLEDLLLAHEGAKLLGTPAAIARVTGMLDYLWSDFAANALSSRGTLMPPYSRTYDFAAGQGSLAYALWLEGLGPSPSATLYFAVGSWLATGGTGGYRPPATSFCWSSASPRVMTSEWQGNGRTQRTRYAYIAPDFSLGSATGIFPVNGYIDPDMLVAGALPGGPTVPFLSVLPDWLNAPFAPITSGDFTKVTHLTLDPASVQDEGALLVLARVNAADPGYPAAGGGTVPLVNLTTNLILPAMVDGVLVNGASIDPTKSGTAAFPPLVVAQNQGGVMGMGIIDASGLDCVGSSGAITEMGTPHVDVLPLPVTGAQPAVRLAIRHLDAPPADTSTLAKCFVRVALLMVGRHCDGTGCGASLSSDMQTAVKGGTSSFDPSTGTWSVTVQAPGGATLKVSRPTAVAGTVTSAQVNGVTPSWVPLSINGVQVPLSP
jgi:hypothetical protein